MIIRVIIRKLKTFLVKITPKIAQKKIFLIHSVLKTSPWTYKIKDGNIETIIRRFYEKELLLSNYPEPNNHIRDKVKVVLDL